VIKGIIFEERELGIEFPSREMEQMKNDKCEHDEAARDHVS
jgi:hypothetical protein